MTKFNPRNWYWMVGGSASEVFSSAALPGAASFAAAYVPVTDPTYMLWLAAGNFPTRIVSEAELMDVLHVRVPDLLPSHREAVTAELEATDTVALRCFKADVPFPAEWKTYVASLRSLASASGRDASRPMPTRPSYPAGT